MHTVILLIGGNEGDRLDNIKEAKKLIQNNIGKITKYSSNYKSEPWGFVHQQNFINQIVEVSTELTPSEILQLGQSIEKELGRKPKTKTTYEGRTMDIDILFYDDIVMNELHLTIPHQKLHERKFTLLPLVEKWEKYIHPAMNKTMNILLNECDDNGWVRKME